jgi:TetR/AcrR family transcriptional regulator
VPRRAPRKRVRDADASRAAVFQAAATEFAARGFDGAKVDRIAAAAGVNKGMLYYHFTSKANLYRAVLGDMFASTAAALKTVRDAGGPAEAQIAAFIETIAREGQARPHFPPIWLRELADNGRHLDDAIVHNVQAIVGTLAAILHDGETAGRFRKVPPFLAQLGIVGPLLLFLASAPMRARLAPKVKAPIAEIPREMLIDYVKAMTVGALSAQGAGARE